MQNRSREFIVGIVFFALMGALGVITLVLSGDLLKSTEERTFRFTDVAGLTKGSEVWINGLPSGTVRDVALNADGTVSASVTLKRSIAELAFGRGARVIVKPKSALGGSVIAIETNRADGVPDLDRLLGTTWNSMKDPFVTVGEKAEEMGNNLQDLLRKIEKGDGTLARLINDKTMAEDLAATVSSIRTVASRMENGEGTLGKLSKDESAWNRLNATLEKLEAAADAVNDGKGPLPMLLHDEKVAADLRDVVADFKAVADRLERGEGTLGRLLQEEGPYEDFRASVADLREFTAKLKDGKGLLPRLLSDEGLADEAEAVVADLRGLVADVRAGKGTLGKLITDDGLYNDARDAFRSLQRSSEEARENAPILTFAGFLFRTF